jgi:outer membrane protein
MKQLSLILSGLALVISGVVFYQQMNSKKSSGSGTVEANAKPNNETVANGNFRIAYFDMDSIENNYQYFKDALNSIKAK